MSLLPFETIFTKKSCLDYVKQAKEFMQDEERRALKTPAGFNRPLKQKKRVVLSRQKEDDAGSGHDANKMSFLVRSGTKRLDSADADNVDI